MKDIIFTICITVSASIFSFGQTVWEGEKITFVKENLADWTLPENQDQITDSVWITRANNKGVFNIKTENNYTNYHSPEGTEWAEGTTGNLDDLTFTDYQTAMGGLPPLLNEDFVLHLIAEDIYINIKFISWSGGMTGGFSYERSTDGPPVANHKVDSLNSIEIFPNPATEYLRFSQPMTGVFRISDFLGRGIAEYNCYQAMEIDISQLGKGHYLLSFLDGSGHVQTFPFQKL